MFPLRFPRNLEERKGQNERARGKGRSLGAPTVVMPDFSPASCFDSPKYGISFTCDAGVQRTDSCSWVYSIAVQLCIIGFFFFFYLLIKKLFSRFFPDIPPEEVKT